MTTKPFSETALAKSIAIVFGTALVATCWVWLRPYIFMSSMFAPHGHCYQWDPAVLWTHVSSDFLIGLSYLSISMTLAYLVQKARVPFHLAFIAFGVFIGACGATHFMEIVTVWLPYYWLSAAVKIVTAVASLATATWLFPLLPKAMALAKSTELAEERRLKLETVNRELQALYDKVRDLDQLKTGFFANVSHELRTPLTLILGPAASLKNQNNLTDSQRHGVAVIERNSLILLKLVNDLLDIAKLEAGKMEPIYSEIDLAALFRRTVGNFETLARDRNITLRVDAPVNLRAQVDHEKIQRILLNLISNALKFTPDGGAIHASMSTKENQVQFEISDNGPGVNPEFRSTIFERFKQASGSEMTPGGTGLGLAIVKEFVELHHGKVSVDDAPGGGAKFNVEIPIKAPEGTHVDTPEKEAVAPEVNTRLAMSTLPSAGPTGTSQTGKEPPERTSTSTALTDLPLVDPPRAPRNRPLVLVVEDNADMNSFICNSLSPDFDIASATDGLDGLNKATLLQPDIVVTDMMMPRMSGEKLLSEVKSRPALKDIPVVILTARTDDEARIRALNAGAQEYLSKPVFAEEVRLRIKNLVSIKRTREVLQNEMSSQNENIESLANAMATRTKELAVARKHAEEANIAKDQFLMVLSHELRTPLTPILGWSKMLQSTDMDSAGLMRGLKVIEKNAKAQTQLIEDLLDISRIVTGKMRLNIQSVELSSVIEAALDTIRPAAESKSISIQTSLDSSSGSVNGDPDRLQQVVWNLLSNAVKFTPTGGKVTVSLAGSESKAVITVSDTGEGINPEFLPHAFERFKQADSSTTRAYGGLGLGLSIVRHIVELHGGKVSVQSAGKGQGATFNVMLPASSTSKSSPKKTGTDSGGWRARTANISLNGLRILVVDDENDAREMIATIVEIAGATVIRATGASEALSVLNSTNPNFVISDIGMPGEDGHALIAKIRSLEGPLGKIPAIALTSFARPEDRVRILEEGFQMHISKPVDPATLLMAISSIRDAPIKTAG